MPTSTFTEGHTLQLALCGGGLVVLVVFGHSASFPWNTVMCIQFQMSQAAQVQQQH